MTPVNLIIPDAGPLISLAHAGRLDLVEVFNRPVAVIDVVKLECLKKPDSPDHAVMKAWFHNNSNAIRIIETPIRPVYEQALQEEVSGENPRATRGLGDAAYGWLLPNIDLVAPRGTIPLVLTEDKNLSITLADHQVAHILSTRAWLAGLENAGVIESAEEIIAEIGRHGRSLSTLQVDRPTEIDEDETDWLTSAFRDRGLGR